MLDVQVTTKVIDNRNICHFENITTEKVGTSQLTELSFSIDKNETVAVIGSNGSGKTLIGKLLNKELPIINGSYTLPNSTALVSFEKINALIEEDRINADITEATLLNPGLTCEELIINECPKPSKLPELLKEYNLYNKRKLAIRHLSTGEIAKALLIAALLSYPALIILDEPYDGLDKESRSLLSEAIKQIIASGISLVLILNRLEEIPSSIGTIMVMDKCSITLKGPTKNIFKESSLKRLFTLSYSLPTVLPGRERITSPSVDKEGRLVSMRNVTIRFGNKMILNAISWDLFPGDHWQISGPNGCGKSTLLQLISGDHPQAYKNDITLFGKQRGTGETIWDIKKSIGLVSTLFHRDYRVSGSILSVVISGFYDSIGLYQRPSGKEKVEAIQWLKIVGLSDQKNRSFQALSYGEQQVVLIMRAMVKRPTILILDEPCLGLDPIHRQLVLKLVQYIAENGNTTILYVTHHEEDTIDAIANRMHFIPARTGGYTLQ